MKSDFAIVNHLMKLFSLIRGFWYTDEIGNPAVPIIGPCRFVRIDTMSRTAPAQGGPATLAFRIRVVMAERGIRSVAALQRMLKSIGVDHICPVDFRTITSGYRRGGRQNSVSRRQRVDRLVFSQTC